MPPTIANGKICYVEIPAVDVLRSIAFYEAEFRWPIYIMVDNIAATIDAIHAHGGEIVKPVGVDAPEITARFRDPTGNVLGL